MPVVFAAGPGAKLASLLTLSAGTLSFVTGEAQITWSGVQDIQVGFGVGDAASYTVDLPGTDDLRVLRSSSSGTRYVEARRVPGGNLRLRTTTAPGGNYFFKPAAAGQQWGTLGGGIFSGALLGSVGSGGTAGGFASFSHQYALFRFADSTAGNALRYGWADFSVVSGGPNTPSITLHSWAYDASGAQIGAGAVPEPQAAALATSFALILGAAGLRAWRQRRVTS